MQNFRENFKYYFVGFLVVIAIFVWYTTFTEDRNGYLTVAFLDVGQGDAVFIDAPNGNQILIDSGVNKKVLSELGKIMPFYDRSIDVILATHPDGDHIGGFPSVLDKFKVSTIIESGNTSGSPVYEEFNKKANEENAKRILARRGQRIELGFVGENDVYLEILFPDRDVSGLEANDASIVAKLVYGSNSFLLTGDSPKKMEEYLVSLSPEDLDVDVLKLGHHGSKTSTSESLVGFASPEYVIIQVGENNYGHPSPETLETLNNFEIPILRNDLLGAIIMKSDGEGVWFLR